MILVAGSANLDFVVRAAHIPAPGETVMGRELRTFAGGKGANQAIACARAGGAATQMLLALGDDAYALPVEASLRDAGVQLHIKRGTGEATGTAFICVADDAENAIIVAPGANASLRPADLPGLAGVSHLLLQLEIPIASVTAYANAARAAGVKVVLNAAPAMNLARELLAMVDVLIVNEGEAAAITGIKANLDAALAALAVPCVVVTLGASGCRARCDGVFFKQPAFLVPAIDTTAAGDTFCGALVAELARATPLPSVLPSTLPSVLPSALPSALLFASAAAALACTRLGAQASIPARDEVLAFLRSHPVQT